jgi:serine/threonine-protein kinase
MGHVYRATAPDGSEVALKVMRPELSENEPFRRRFEREAKVARKVSNPHVVPILDHGDVEGSLYLTQTYMRGGSLDARLEQEGRLAPNATLRICEQVAEGLQAMHDAGLVHRDVKPHNIMFDDRGDASLADLGLAKDREASVVLTKIGQAVGSIHYMSPEQIRSERRPDARTDVYGLGCVAYECVSGSPPFATRKPMQVMWAHLRDDPVDPSEKVAEVPAAFGAVLIKALEKEPERRPQSARDYVEMLRRALDESSAGVP